MRIPLQEQILFYKNLAVMIKAGMPILDSLRILQKQTKSRALAKILNQLIHDVANGQFLSTSMERFSSAFGESAINIIRVGEASGILYENLNYISEELKKGRELKRKVVGALIYPLIIVIATIAIIGLLTVYIFPKLLPLFKSFKGQLPFTTRILIATSDFFINYGGWLLLGTLILITGFWLLNLKIAGARSLFHRLILMMPLVGGLSQSYNITNFCRTLGLLLKSDIKVVEALSITASTLKNEIYKKEFQQMSREISQGEEMSKHLERKPALFPAMLGQLVSIGETTGNLSETLLYLSDFYEHELDETTENLSVALEPILMVVMGVIVGFVAISIITPIYGITESLGK